jgi:hypothetical protein
MKKARQSPEEAVVCRFVAASPSLRRCSGRPIKRVSALQQSAKDPSPTDQSPPPRVRLLARVAESPSRPAAAAGAAESASPHHRCLRPPANGNCTYPSTGARRHARTWPWAMARSHRGPGAERDETATSTEPNSPLSPERKAPPANLGLRSNVRATPPPQMLCKRSQSDGTFCLERSGAEQLPQHSERAVQFCW